MKTAKITEILDYCDGIVTFAAQDPIGGHYVGFLIESDAQKDHRYLVVGARPRRLNDLQGGKVDLRTLMLQTPEDTWYTATPEGSIDDPFTLEPQQTSLAESGYLPAEAYYLGPPAPPDVNAKIQSALEQGLVFPIVGRLEQANRATGEWGLLTDRRIITGKVAPDGAGLPGLRIGQRYCFECAEVTQQDTLWRDRTTLFLVSVTTC